MMQIMHAIEYHTLQYIEQILYFTKDYVLISIVLGFLAAFIESFIPALPLLAIVGINAAINGFVIGFLISWLGSCAGTLVVYLLVSHLFSDNWLEKKREKHPRIDRLVEKILNNEFKALFVFYAIPVLPSSLFTLASAACKINLKDFIPPMVFGKFLMLFVGAFIGSDIEDFIHSPIKIIAVLTIGVISYIVARKMKQEMETYF